MITGVPNPQDEEVESSTLSGLGAQWEKDDVIRQNTLKNNSVLVWPKPTMVGVISFETVAINARVLDYMLRLHCPRLSQAKTVNIDHVRSEDRYDQT